MHPLALRGSGTDARASLVGSSLSLRAAHFFSARSGVLWSTHGRADAPNSAVARASDPPQQPRLGRLVRRPSGLRTWNLITEALQPLRVVAHRQPLKGFTRVQLTCGRAHRCVSTRESWSAEPWALFRATLLRAGSCAAASAYDFPLRLGSVTGPTLPHTALARGFIGHSASTRPRDHFTHRRRGSESPP